MRLAVSRWKRADSSRADPLGRTLRPTDFGADPTCTQDSSPAFDALTAALANMTVGVMADGIKDLGGATVDLGAGCYLLSRTWAIPAMVANFHVAGGELRAAPVNSSTPFSPVNGTLVSVGGPCSPPPSGQGVCNQNAAFHGVAFDGSHIAGINLQINFTMGAVVDSSSVVLNFNTVGVWVHGGHEVVISETWVAAYPWSSHGRRITNSTGIWCVGSVRAHRSIRVLRGMRAACGSQTDGPISLTVQAGWQRSHRLQLCGVQRTHRRAAHRCGQPGYGNPHLEPRHLGWRQGHRQHQLAEPLRGACVESCSVRRCR